MGAAAELVGSSVQEPSVLEQVLLEFTGQSARNNLIDDAIKAEWFALNTVGFAF
jgi:hypothetical protein